MTETHICALFFAFKVTQWAKRYDLPVDCILAGVCQGIFRWNCDITCAWVLGPCCHNRMHLLKEHCNQILWICLKAQPINYFWLFFSFHRLIWGRIILLLFSRPQHVFVVMLVGRLYYKIQFIYLLPWLQLVVCSLVLYLAVWVSISWLWFFGNQQRVK